MVFCILGNLVVFNVSKMSMDTTLKIKSFGANAVCGAHHVQNLGVAP